MAGVMFGLVSSLEASRKQGSGKREEGRENAIVALSSLFLALPGVGVEGEFAATVLGLGLFEGGSVGSGTDDLATVRADGFRLGAEAGDEVFESGHGFEGSDEMGSIEPERYRTCGLEPF
jgi:hypothetical protein